MYNKIHILLAALTGATAGVAGGYFFARKQLQAKYDYLLEEELKSTRDFYAMMHKKGEYATVEKAAESLGVEPASITVKNDPRPSVERLIQGLGYRGVNAISSETATKVAGPYIIPLDEYMSGESEYEQVTLTYFEEDDVLCDDGEMPLDDVDNIVGLANLQAFGRQSKDANVVYVRNDRLQIDYEICRDLRSYAEVVAGFVKARARPARKMPKED